MGRTRRKPLFLIVGAEIVCSISKEKVLDFDHETTDGFFDADQSPHFDDVMIALRKSFSLTFPRNPFIDGLQEALKEIRRIGVDALRTIPEVVEELGLKTVPAPSYDKEDQKAYLFKYCVVRSADLQFKVTYEGKSVKLLSLFDQVPADDLVRTLRDVVSDTFQEMYNEDQHEEVLRRIRQRIGSILPAFNEFLVSIEIEPIADMSLLEDSDYDAEHEEAAGHTQTPSNSVGGTPSSGKPSPK